MITAGLYAQPYQTGRPVVAEDPQMKQLKIALSDLGHHVKNHEAEIRTLEERLRNQEASLDHMQGLNSDELQSQRDSTKANVVNLEGKISAQEAKVDGLDRVSKGMTADLRQLQTQSNELISAMKLLKQKVEELEKSAETQSFRLNSLETALRSVVEMIEIKENPIPASTGKIYRVQAGDTLEKIARAQKVSVQSLKEANQMVNDKIVVGQTLKLP